MSEDRRSSVLVRKMMVVAATTFVTLLPAIRLEAQTRDQARLVINIFGGYMSGTSLWRVTGQPLYDDGFGETLVDTLTVSRRIRPNPIFGARFLLFPGDRLGYFGEAFLLGLGYDDQCARTFATGSSRNAQVCENISRNESPASAVQVAGGLMYRLASQSSISPYARVSAGAALGNRSPTVMTGRFISPSAGDQSVDVDLYTGRNGSQLHPAFGVGVGFTSQVGRGYQIRWEVRDNIVGVNTVTGPTVQDGTLPETSMRFRHRLSLDVGFDVVLERKAGRRY